MDNNELVVAALSDGPEAFTPIVNKYKNAVFAVALMRVRNFHDAEDLTQEAFLEAFERLEKLKDPVRLGAWLRSIVIHRCINFLKRKIIASEVSKNGHAASGLAVIPASIEQEDLRNQIFSAIEHLSKVQEELKKIGTPGIEGFIKACDSPHWPTRTRAIMGLLNTNPEPVELVIELLKKRLKDSNKKVRRAAIAGLLGANVSDEKKRKEFFPLILPLYADPSKRVRRGLSQTWIMHKWLADIPLEIIAEAIQKEEDRKIVALMQRLLLNAIEVQKESVD